MKHEPNIHMSQPQKSVFFDRDDVVNVDHGYVHRWDDFHIYPGVPEALARLRQAGWLLIWMTLSPIVLSAFVRSTLKLRFKV